MLLIEIAMLIGGIYAIVFAKVPSLLVGAGKHSVEGLIARWIGVLLILPLPIAFLGNAILPLLFGKDGAQYAGMLELITVLGFAILSGVLIRVAGKRVEPVNYKEATTSMNTVESPAKISSLQITLYLVMAATLILAIWIRLMGAGWFLVIFGLILVIIAGFHLRFQVSAIRRVSKMKPSYISLILLSNLFFFLGFALQVDFGDQYGDYVALAIFYDHYFKHESWDYLMEHQPAELNIYMYTSIAFLVALIVSWFFLRGKHFLKQENSD
jgi:hypothetical protein